MKVLELTRSRLAFNIIAGALLAVLCVNSVFAQTYGKGRHIEPAFEGWRPNDDGTFNMMFGYMNENWEETPNMPVGENNNFSPGDMDRGQPTHFLPRRNRFTFEVAVPSDWGDRELVWTLNINGVERKAYATLKPDYLVDNMVIASETGSLGAGTSSPESRANIPPVVTVQGDSIRTAAVGEPIDLRAQIADDGLPQPTDLVEEARRFVELTEGGSLAAAFITAEAIQNQRLMSPPIKVTVNKVNGLYYSWNKWRGPGDVIFNPPQVKVWEDTRTSANSPWGVLWLPPPIPEDGIYEVNAVFTEPGEYVLWGRADDGGLYHDAWITVNVSE
ncbi:MAG: hypothetical protein VX506_02865 [Pseudomonadota bacterium]|nr:hypothetical protein [Pseudomonadota bacterium]MED5385073.1 hypothetical protein [Pseudomonadota bacterium]|tara:strand:- start:906 stop:1898 length:993 start_codon:yes stop_codon:yes gene_type:complete